MPYVVDTFDDSEHKISKELAESLDFWEEECPKVADEMKRRLIEEINLWR